MDEFGKGINFMHLNVRSLLAKNKFEMFKAQITGCKFTALTLSESWLNTKIPDSMIRIPGFNSFRLNRKNSCKSRGGED